MCATSCRSSTPAALRSRVSAPAPNPRPHPSLTAPARELLHRRGHVWREPPLGLSAPSGQRVMAWGLRLGTARDLELLAARRRAQRLPRAAEGREQDTL